MLLKGEKQAIMKEYATKADDTGSPEVQVAVLTEEINRLTVHMKEHKHDFHSQRGLMQKVGKRRNLLKYLKNMDLVRYTTLIQRLGLRK
ncbi:MAG: 30S ribosomal protein S15 [Breznakia sp.]